ncbi:MAG TPA: gliding motility-associated C-terminal domain-containing protein, partial [Ferruginibacter sp.]|nr:gliding motility-associated C-terminal domain-containing protein [Ferruginibacter sp.]
IQVFCDKLLVFNGFSPNGDQVNDYWHILGIEAYPDNTVQVFNRWGNLVFEQKGYTNAQAWDGTWNGKALPDGTYYYLVDPGKGSKIRSGYLELVR